MRTPAATMTSAVAAATSTSTTGMTEAESMPARRVARRLRALIRSKRRAFSSSRLRPCTTRTPLRSSFRVLLTPAMVMRTSRKARRANLLQMIITPIRMGSTAKVNSASCQSRISTAATTMASPMTSAMAVSTPLVRSSCSTCTSDVTRDITRPTSASS